ncbi:ferritin-like protein [Streptomyces sp. CT34]|uniref:ferritin-like domain-containing protein n=1 Tax=Streptomyces sp. CT34 TaxID=1553907 RepID=UPI00068E528A|nr:ferritin-like protein [Streptomyces sp. CT34]
MTDPWVYDRNELTQKKATKKGLLKLLQAALKLELTTVPLYLTGMYTIKPGTNREAFLTMRSVVMEEMLHMALVSNLINALGGQPVLDDPRYLPSYPGQMPYGYFDPAKSDGNIALLGYSSAALQLFVNIESPPWDKPALDNKGWRTIGQFYGLISNWLEELQEKDEELFNGNPSRQLTPEHFYNSGGEVVEVHDYKSACTAIEVVVEEGEGLDGSFFTSDDKLFNEERQEAHYFRFMEILYEHRYGPYDKVRDIPSGASMDIDWKSAYRIDGTKPVDREQLSHEAVARLDTFDLTYTKLLLQIHKAVNGAPDSMKNAIPTMLDLRYQAEEIFRIPRQDAWDTNGRPLSLHPSFTVTTDLIKQVRDSDTKLGVVDSEIVAPVKH